MEVLKRKKERKKERKKGRNDKTERGDEKRFRSSRKFARTGRAAALFA